MPTRPPVNPNDPDFRLNALACYIMGTVHEGKPGVTAIAGYTDEEFADALKYLTRLGELAPAAPLGSGQNLPPNVPPKPKAKRKEP